MTPILIGYFPKRRTERGEWPHASGVEELCNVSEHAAAGPEGWLKLWRHNDLWVYDSPEIAWSVVSEREERSTYDLFAYKAFPVRFVAGREEPWAIPPWPHAPLDRSFRRLGCDLVTRWAGAAFECSPLFCNDLAKECAANRYCLIDDAESALRLASEMEAEGGEPGPYHVLEVWRQESEGGG